MLNGDYAKYQLTPNTTKREYRYELKYFTDTYHAKILKQRINKILSLDNHSEDMYHITSLYFDDYYNTALYQKQNGATVRDKMRIRYYNNSLDVIKLECKHKHGEMISKEVDPLSAEQYDQMLHGNYMFMSSHSGHVIKKFYHTHLCNCLRPVVFVDYDREPYVYDPGNVRIAFDTNLTSRCPGFDHYVSALPSDVIILEIKYDHFLPSVIADLFLGVPLTHLAISKYIITRNAINQMSLSPLRDARITVK